MITKTRFSKTVRFLIYITLNLLTAGIAIGSFLFIPQVNPSLIFLPTIAFFAFYGGFIIGSLTTIISIISIVFLLFYPSNHPFSLPRFFELGILLFVGMFISYLMHIARQQDKIIEYQKRLRQTHHIIEALEKNYDSAQSEIKARDQFLAIASHELKTPVTSMLLQVQTAIHNIRNVSLANFSVSTLLKMLEDTEQQSNRLSKMVNDLLDLSLITTGKIDLEPEETDITRLATDVAQRFTARQADKKQITMVTEKPVVGSFDKLRIEQAIINLLSNAIKYGNNKPITIHVSNSSDHARISVNDQGIGIPAEQQKKIFNRFERAVSSRDYKGLGVGLYITYQIVKAHKGKIYLESRPDKGSTFTLELPLNPPKV